MRADRLFQEVCPLDPGITEPSLWVREIVISIFFLKRTDQSPKSWLFTRSSSFLKVWFVWSVRSPPAREAMLLGFSAGRSLTQSRYGDSISANPNALAVSKFHQLLLQNVLIQSAQLTGDKGQILPAALEGMLARRHLGFELSGFLCCSAAKSSPTPWTAAPRVSSEQS